MNIKAYPLPDELKDLTYRIAGISCPSRSTPCYVEHSLYSKPTPITEMLWRVSVPVKWVKSQPEFMNILIEYETGQVINTARSLNDVAASTMSSSSRHIMALNNRERIYFLMNAFPETAEFKSLYELATSHEAISAFIEASKYSAFGDCKRE